MNRNYSGYDIIGDIHGYADTLRALLERLGYREKAGVYSHCERQAIFVGDYIDRGPKIRETLRIVRGMVEAGHALALIGNHEFSAIRYHTKGPHGSPLSPLNKTNLRHHCATLEQLATPHPQEWLEWLEWFRSLPLSLDLGGLRIVHAAWCAESVQFVANRRFCDADFLLQASTPKTPERAAVDSLLSGPELQLPAGYFIHDRHGKPRRQMRARWFNRHGWKRATFRELAMPANGDVPDIEVDLAALSRLPNYDPAAPPVLFGHYWMPPLDPAPLARNVACVDYSIASETGGLLVAYRWSAETELSSSNFVAVRRL